MVNNTSNNCNLEYNLRNLAIIIEGSYNNNNKKDKCICKINNNNSIEITKGKMNIFQKIIIAKMLIVSTEHKIKIRYNNNRINIIVINNL